MTNSDKPEGMVDYLESIGAGPTEEEIAYVMASLKPGPMDSTLLALAADPVRIAAREARAAERQARDWAQLGQYRGANAALAGKPVKAVFIGDSITEIWAAYHSVLRADDDSMRSEFTRDGLHPGADGYAVMRPVARSALAIALG